ncbi:MAG: helix-turn-helix domain-containing protein [Clostridiales bacterium]|jgi:transcriptional regulator with XRE-family HTH domain|nr:helix-turn-helix domain-containing protein [Clostridiales bacterium]
MDIGERMKFLRKQLELTQSDFAERIGITNSALSDIERGRTKSLTERNIASIATMYGVNPEWLRSGAEPVFFAGKLPMDALAAQYGMTELELDIMRQYMRLPFPVRRRVFTELAAFVMASEAEAALEPEPQAMEYFDKKTGSRIAGASALPRQQ